MIQAYRRDDRTIDYEALVIFFSQRGFCLDVILLRAPSRDRANGINCRAGALHVRDVRGCGTLPRRSAIPASDPAREPKLHPHAAPPHAYGNKAVWAPPDGRAADGDGASVNARCRRRAKVVLRWGSAVVRARRRASSSPTRMTLLLPRVTAV